MASKKFTEEEMKHLRARIFNRAAELPMPLHILHSDISFLYAIMAYEQHRTMKISSNAKTRIAS